MRVCVPRLVHYHRQATVMNKARNNAGMFVYTAHPQQAEKSFIPIIIHTQTVYKNMVYYYAAAAYQIN